jgi:hypothetical protein
MEIGFAAGARVPIFATSAPGDLTLREYVRIVPSLAEAAARATAAGRNRPTGGLLVDAKASIEKVQKSLEGIKDALTRPNGVLDPALNAYRQIEEIHSTLRLPTAIQ